MRGLVAVLLTIFAGLWLSMAVTAGHDTIQFVAAGVSALVAAALLAWEEDS
jgi:hypothetical protein